MDASPQTSPPRETLRGGGEEKTNPALEDSREELTLYELKLKLKEGFERTGVLSDIKAKLRKQLLVDLKALSPENIPRTSPPPSLHGQLLRWIIADHLERDQLRLSLSVFVPEALSSSLATPSVAQRPSYEDILRGLQIPQNARKQLLLADNGGSSGTSPSVAPSLLDRLARLVARERDIISGPPVECAVQTEGPSQGSGEWLRRAIELSEETRRKKMEEELKEPQLGIEEKMLAYRKECDVRAARQLQLDMESFKRRELEIAVAEVSARHRAEIAQLQREHMAVEATHIAQVRDAEAAARRRLEERQRRAEAANHDARQRLMAEMETARAREEEARSSTALAMRSVKLEELRLKEELVRIEAREKEVKRLEAEVQRRIEAETATARRQVQESVRLHEESLKREREAVSREAATLASQRKDVEEALSEKITLKSELGAAKARLAELEPDLAAATEELQAFRDTFVLNSGDPSSPSSKLPGKSRLPSYEEMNRRLKRALTEAESAKKEAEAAKKENEVLKRAKEEAELAAHHLSLEFDDMESKMRTEAVARAAADAEVGELRKLLSRSREALAGLQALESDRQDSIIAATVALPPLPVAQTSQAKSQLSASYEFCRDQANEVERERRELDERWRGLKEEARLLEERRRTADLERQTEVERLTRERNELERAVREAAAEAKGEARAQRALADALAMGASMVAARSPRARSHSPRQQQHIAAAGGSAQSAFFPDEEAGAPAPQKQYAVPPQATAAHPPQHTTSDEKKVEAVVQSKKIAAPPIARADSTQQKSISVGEKEALPVVEELQESEQVPSELDSSDGVLAVAASAAPQEAPVSPGEQPELTSVNPVGLSPGSGVAGSASSAPLTEEATEKDPVDPMLEAYRGRIRERRTFAPGDGETRQPDPDVEGQVFHEDSTVLSTQSVHNLEGSVGSEQTYTVASEQALSDGDEGAVSSVDDDWF